MDRNQIIGIVLIAAILIGYSIFTAPSKEEIEKARLEQIKQDSINKVQLEIEKQKALELEIQDSVFRNNPQAQADSLIADSVSQEKLKEEFASFGESALGENEFITLENDLLKVKISTKGGRPYSVQLKDYMRFDSLPLLLFDGDENIFGMTFFAENRKIATNDLFFKPVHDQKEVTALKSKESLSLRLHAGEGRYIEYTYTIVPGSYLLDFDIHFVGMDKLISKTNSFIDLNWYKNVPSLEKGKEWENQYTGIYYKHHKDEVEWLSETSSKDEINVSTKIKWIAIKQQFFSSILIAKDAFLNAKLSQTINETDPNYLKECNAFFSIPFDGKSDETFSLSLFYGPNKYKILNNTYVAEGEDLNLKKMLPLGWGIFGWINRFAIIPMFNWLGGFISNFGILILIMTLIIKLVLFPLTFKSYQSSAKMRVLKPQIDAINAKIPKDKAMERQQATMALYKKAGVNPMGGCLPMLVQFPFLIAMYRFFPASIELRQESFLWATDLSSYDSILNLPFTIPWYGDHVSLFTLLMAVSIVFSTKINGAQMQGSSQMPGMKMMMYMMPVMMLIWFNKYSSGLSYYYFLSNVITIGQTLIIRRFIDDDAVLQKLNENKKKPKSKSKFQARLEEMAKQKGYPAKKK